MEIGSDGASTPSGCMANLKTAVAAVAWDPPPCVKKEVRRIAELAGASWGSVELLWPQGADQEQRLYFDLNLSCISTMPDTLVVSDSNKIWEEDFDPYTALARFVICKVVEKSAA
ncbi:unnamed protein product [Polarella glacialis]|uniref:Uncharacterized protein n=1 Tax=Polarella glacialis TaxID=89957 RepID=A0A813FEQ0_POLGL|nr:unnamed protein product [Polarella glacialis]